MYLVMNHGYKNNGTTRYINYKLCMPQKLNKGSGSLRSAPYGSVRVLIVFRTHCLGLFGEDTTLGGIFSPQTQTA